MNKDTDRELLEQAAKASRVFKSVNQAIESGWNPITNDGDAILLAMWCDILFIPSKYYRNEPDPAFAARLHVVRAAAAIGKAMP
jgi:hypothetical protein